MTDALARFAVICLIFYGAVTAIMVPILLIRVWLAERRWKRMSEDERYAERFHDNLERNVDRLLEEQEAERRTREWHA